MNKKQEKRKYFAFIGLNTPRIFLPTFTTPHIESKISNMLNWNYLTFKVKRLFSYSFKLNEMKRKIVIISKFKKCGLDCSN